MTKPGVDVAVMEADAQGRPPAKKILRSIED
jgi:hypothetical protein